MSIRKSKYLVIVILLTFANGLRAQTATLLPPGNANFSSLEKNILFYADKRFAVSQTGSAQVYLPAMFDGGYMPSYTTAAPSIGDPTVITIENLPLIHTQRGAYVGWTTRYWAPTKFKIEGFASDNVWTTIADESNYGGYDYITSLYGLFSKLRFTFYTASGVDGRLGLSEIFFLHGEGVQAYDGLMVKYNNDGNVGIGTPIPHSALHVSSAGTAIDASGQFNGNVIIQGNSGGRSLSNGAALEFALPANTDGGNIWGQARILAVSGNLIDGNATGKMILGTRRSFSKNNAGNAWYYGDDLVIDGVGNVGIGTLNPTAQLHVSGTAIIGNPLGGNYNENLRLPVANDDYASIALGTDNTPTGSIQGQWSLVRNPSTMGNRFSIRHKDDELLSMQTNGNLGIGTTNPTQKLAVNGTVLAKKVKVSQAAVDWPDYVFDSSYQLPSLDSVSTFIQTNKHLPDMPSAATVEKDGHDLGEVQKQLLKKVEELTLYVIELKKENSELKEIAQRVLLLEQKIEKQK